MNDLAPEFDNYVSLLRYRAEKQPDCPAYLYLNRRLDIEEKYSYSQLDVRVRSIAVRIQKFNSRGKRVVLLLHSDLDYVASFIACLFAGGIAVTLHPPSTSKQISRIESVVNDSGAGIVLTTSKIFKVFAEKIRQVTILNDIDWIFVDEIGLTDADAWQNPELNSRDLAFLQYTSGSTSTPKGVMVSHDNLVFHGEYLHRAFAIRETDVFITWLPHFHDLGLIYGILLPLYSGCPCYVMKPMTFLKRPMIWVEAISRFNVSITGAPNFAYDLCVETFDSDRSPFLNLSSWEVALNGAEPVRATTVEAFAKTFAPFGFKTETFQPSYGMAEATLVISTGARGGALVTRKLDGGALLANKAVTANADSTNTRTVVGCGHARGDSTIRIADPDTLDQLPANEIGEILVSGRSIAGGYYQDSASTEDTFNTRLSIGDGPYLRTGDLGFLDENGELYISGRHKDLIIIHGSNHAPQDIEFTIEQSNTAIRSSFTAAFSIDIDETEYVVVIAEVKRQTEADFDAKNVSRAIFKNIVMEHEIDLYEIVFIRRGRFPKTTSGKVQRRLCKQMLAAGEFDIIAKCRNRMFHC